MADAAELWKRYCDYLYLDRRLGFSLDVSRMAFDHEFVERMTPPLGKAISALKALEGGALANVDENRMVGHYWLRNPDLAPTPEIREEIRATFHDIRDFAEGVRQGQTRGEGGPFENLLVIGIGGSALGPQFLADALGSSEDQIRPFFSDNCDPDGIDRTFGCIGNALDRTLTLVVSKSGGTAETRNGMLEAMAAYKSAGLDFAEHAVAITQRGSQLDQRAETEKWRQRFPMWDWVGGRTSVTSAVGLLPAALQGIDIEGFLRGAATMDEATRRQDALRNPAALLAMAWFFECNGRGEKDMVVLPYKDRLALFSRYLQQLVMESLGKGSDRHGHSVNQGITVYGNKGSTDQHAYVQQLRDGVRNFFVNFVEVLHDRDGAPFEVEEGITTGDYLHGFLQGTRRALYENGRGSITISINTVTPESVGQLVALFERAVGIYAELIDVNAYHQPGVEAGKRAAQAVLDLQTKVLELLRSSDEPRSAAEIALAIGSPEEAESVFRILEHLSVNVERRVIGSFAASPAATVFRLEA